MLTLSLTVFVVSKKNRYFCHVVFTAYSSWQRTKSDRRMYTTETW